jgi:15-cis-phytoene synthase
VLVGAQAWPSAGEYFVTAFAVEQLVASHEACRSVTRQAGSNFPAAFCLLPKSKRQAMLALYAFMRHSDDLADDPPPGCQPSNVLQHWRAAFQAAIAGNADIEPSDVDPRGRAILPAVIQTVREFHIPAESLLAVLDGVEMDLEPRTYETFDELAVYCERVASAVGLACIHVWGFHGPEALGPSRSAGLAFQLTNILRDLHEDARRGRVYLPQEDLRACGYSIEELRHGAINAAFQRLMNFEIERAEQFYREAAELPRWLHRDGHRIYGLMIDTYHALLESIRRRPADVFAHRIRVSRWKKLWLAARWTIWPKRLK